MPTSYLCFRQEAPLASFGNARAGTRFTTDRTPRLSVIHGMIAAAFGIEREDLMRAAQVYKRYGIATRVDRAGELTTDYHTAWIPRRRRTQVFSSRVEELNSSKGRTYVTKREYLEGVLYKVAVWSEQDDDTHLYELRDALREPFFPLYLGRKCCVLSGPLCPMVVEAERLTSALQQFDREVRLDRQRGTRPLLWEKPAPHVNVGVDVQYRRMRRDDPVPFSAHAFRKRVEFEGQAPVS